MALRRTARALALLTLASCLSALPTAAQSGPVTAVNKRLLRVPLDSGAVHISVHERAASVTVVSPAGTFLRAFATDAPLVEWADQAEALPAPRPSSAGDSAQVGLSAARLADSKETAQREHPTEFLLLRLPDDSVRRFALRAGNGVWQSIMIVRGAQATMLFAALRGDSASGATPLSLGTIGKTRAEDRPDEFGAWPDETLSRQVRIRGASPTLRYPRSLAGSGVEGTVRLWFIVDSTGRVRPSSIRLIGRAHPTLALAAREVLERMQFHPAERSTRPVAQLLTQDFVFREP